jgi:5'-phosphate synthase pdxT subunit
MVKIGVLGIQGAIAEHVKALEASNTETVIVKRPAQLDGLDGLVMPGGESTTMRRLIDKYELFEPLREFAVEGKPVFGTCAGMILMAKNIEGQDNAHLALMNMTVRRNAFGRQRESFEAELMIKDFAKDFIGVFIRAPYVVEVGEDVEVLSKVNGQIVAAREDHLLTCSFHPELTADTRFHDYFVKMVEETKEDLHKIQK